MCGPTPTRATSPTSTSAASSNIGRSLVVEQAIQNGRGKVRVGDTLWQAEGPMCRRARA